MWPFEHPSYMADQDLVAHNLRPRLQSRRQPPSHIREHASGARGEGHH